MKVLKQAEHIAAPSRSDGGSAESIFEDEVPADDPGEYLAQSRIAIRVCRPRDWDHGGELSVAKAGKHATDGG